MELFRILFLLCLAHGFVAEAKSSMRRVPKEGDLKALQVKLGTAEKARISPELEHDSASKFEKDLPWDKRPKADPFHFKHPYPVVQDSGDYDRDYVKDENSDNGNWKAQETYDRLRTKLRREKRDLAKALAKKQEEENELKNAMNRHDKEQHDREQAQKEAERARREAEAKRRDKQSNPFDAVKRIAEDAVEPKSFDVSTKDTEKAMSNLEDCKKQLAEARQKLKDLMKELEDAKEEQNKANKVLDKAMHNDLTEKEHHAMLKKNMNKAHDEYLAAKEAYEKQQAVLAKLKMDIKDAEAKVRAMRDAEDPNGGVYNTPEEKSGAAAHWLWAPIFAIMACAM